MPLSAILGGLPVVGNLIGKVGEVIDSLHTSGEEKATARLAVEKLAQDFEVELEKSYRAEVAAKERIMVAELQQSDAYTKRARPSIVYAWIGQGLLVTALTFVVIFMRVTVPDVGVLGQLMIAWMGGGAGVVATYTITRGVEKRGIARDGSRVAAVVSAITGNRQLP